MNTISERNAAWRAYQARLSNLTEREEAQIERAYMAGWNARGAYDAEAVTTKGDTEQ
jgi:hypothetical protein